MMSLVDHARREMELCGQMAEDPAYAQSIIAAVAAFSSYGHSGGSSEIAVGQLTRLLSYENLTPLTDAPAEWADRSEQSGLPMWQSVRNPKAFSADGGHTHYLVDEPKGKLYATAPAVPPMELAQVGQPGDARGVEL